MEIDLNADLGEGCGSDEALLDLVSSANIACGWHAGGATAMRDCVRWAVAEGRVDRRASELQRSARTSAARKWICRPTRSTRACCISSARCRRSRRRRAGASRTSSRTARSTTRRRATRRSPMRSSRPCTTSIRRCWCSGSRTAGSSRRRATRGSIAIEEVFADRGYRADGSLVPRKEPGALLDDEDVVLDRTLAMVREQRVQAVSGEWVPLNAQTICLHGDGAHALAFARRIRARAGDGGHRSARGARRKRRLRGSRQADST